MARLKLIEMDPLNKMIYFRKDDKLIAFDADVAIELISDSLDGKYATVRHGRWIEREEWFEGEPKPRKTMGCSECGHSMYSKHDTLSYCPNCGAKMDEVD